MSNVPKYTIRNYLISDNKKYFTVNNNNNLDVYQNHRMCHIISRQTHYLVSSDCRLYSGDARRHSWAIMIDGWRYHRMQSIL